MPRHPALPQRNGAVQPPVQEKKAPQTDLQRLHGTWTLVESYTHGKKVAAKEIDIHGVRIESLKLAIDGEKIPKHLRTPRTLDPNVRVGGVDLHINAAKSVLDGDFQLNAIRNPKEITMTWFVLQWVCIYKVQGDTLTLCFNPKNYILPDEFRTMADSERVLFIFKRANPNPEPGKDREPETPKAKGKDAGVLPREDAARPAQAQKPGNKQEMAKQPRIEKRSEKNMWLQKVDVDKRTIDLFKMPLFKDEEGRELSTGYAYSMTLSVPIEPPTQILVDGKKATLADLRTDHAILVNVEYEMEFRDAPKTGNTAIRLEANGKQVGGVVDAINPEMSTIAVTAHDNTKGKTAEINYRVAKDAKVFINGKEASFADLQPRTQVTLQLSAIKPLVVGITGEGPRVDAILKAVDAPRNTITVYSKSTHLTAEGVPVTKDAKVVIDGREGKLADLREGMRVMLQMSCETERSRIVGIMTGKMVGK